MAVVAVGIETAAAAGRAETVRVPENELSVVGQRWPGLRRRKR